MKNPRIATVVATALLLSCPVLAQQSAPPTSSVRNVQVTVPIKEAEVGQEVKITVMATDVSGNRVNEKPSTYLAGPPDVASVDDDGNVKIFGAGEVTVGAIVGGTTGFTTFVVKTPGVKTIELSSIKTPLATGGSVQLDAVMRMANGTPRTGVPIQWTSDNMQVAKVDAGGVVTGVGPGKAVITANLHRHCYERKHLG